MHRCSVGIQSVLSTLSVSTSSALCSVANLVPSVPSINPHYHFPAPSEDSMQATFLKHCSSTSGVEKCVCVCICACVRERTVEAPFACFIIHTHVWILFQPTDTCQRYTQHILMFLLYFLSHLSPSLALNWDFLKTINSKILLNAPLCICLYSICIWYLW